MSMINVLESEGRRSFLPAGVLVFMFGSEVIAGTYRGILLVEAVVQQSVLSEEGVPLGFYGGDQNRAELDEQHAQIGVVEVL